MFSVVCHYKLISDLRILGSQGVVGPLYIIVVLWSGSRCEGLGREAGVSLVPPNSIKPALSCLFCGPLVVSVSDLKDVTNNLLIIVPRIGTSREHLKACPAAVPHYIKCVRGPSDQHCHVFPGHPEQRCDRERVMGQC